MTSKKSSANPFRSTFRQNFTSNTFFAAFAQFAVFVISVFISSLFALGKTVQAGETSQYAKAGSKYVFYFFSSTEDVILALALTVICSMLTAVCAFRFITSKKTVNVYYSLGITRKKLFLGNFLAGALMLSLSVVLPFLGGLIVNLAKIGVSAALIRFFFFYTLSFTAISLATFSITAAVFSSVGTMFEAGVFSVTMLFLPTIFFYCLQTLMKKFVYGNPYGQNFNTANDIYLDGAPTLSGKFRFLSPILFNFTSLMRFPSVLKSDQSTLISPNFLPPLLWLAISFGLMALGMLIFEKRKAEICGFIGTNKYLNTAAVFILGFYLFCVFADKFGETLPQIFIYGGLSFVFVYIILELLLLRDTKKFVHGLLKLPIELAAVGVIVVIFSSGLFGFTQRMPALSEIKSAAVTFAGNGDEFAIASSNRMNLNSDDNFFAAGSLVDGFSTGNDLNTILDIHKAAAKKVSGTKATANTLQIVYHLKNGAEFYRSFESVSVSAYKKLYTLENTDLYRARLKKVFTGAIHTEEQGADPDVTLTNAQNLLRSKSAVLTVFSKYLSAEKQASLTDAGRQKLLAALYQDLQKRTAEQKYDPAETASQYLVFSISQPKDSNEDDWTDDSDLSKDKSLGIRSLQNSMLRTAEDSSDEESLLIAVTPDLTATAAVLKELGLWNCARDTVTFTKATLIPAETVRKAVESNNEYQYNRMYGSRYFLENFGNSEARSSEVITGHLSEGTVITDPEKVHELLSGSFGTYDNSSATGWYAVFSGKNGCTILYLPANALPDDVSVSGNAK